MIEKRLVIFLVLRVVLKSSENKNKTIDQDAVYIGDVESRTPSSNYSK